MSDRFYQGYGEEPESRLVSDGRPSCYRCRGAGRTYPGGEYCPICGGSGKERETRTRPYVHEEDDE